MDVDTSQLRSSPYTTFYQSFFLLRVPLSIGSQPAQITISDNGHLTIGCRYPAVSITFNYLTSEVDTIVQKYGVEGVSNYWCEDVALFELRLSSHDNLKKFLRSEEKVQKELESRLTAKLAEQRRSPEPVAVYAHTEVYMLTPCPESNDARIVRVSSENLATCTTLWKESEVFNFGALFRAFRMDRNFIPNQGEVTVKLLDQELQEVSDWFGLGLHLDIPPEELHTIKYEPTLRRIQDFRTDMFSVWMKKLPEPTWPRVVKALMEIGRERLAHKIALKYGVPAPSLTEKKILQLDTPSLISTPLQESLRTRIEKFEKAVKEKDRELALKDQSLEEAKRRKSEANQMMVQLRQTVKQNNTKTIRLVEEKVEAEKQLHLKEQQLQLLRTIVHKDSELLQNLEKEIMELRQRLQSVEKELTLERNLSKELRQKLQQATEELAMKSAVEQEREEAKEHLKTHLERERQTVDFLRVQLTSKDQHIREVEHQLSTARTEHECNTKEIGQRKLIISEKEEKMKTLSQKLQKQESLIAKLERELTAAREGGATRELELLQRIVKVTDEAAGLRDKLEEAKEEKWEAVKKMEVAQAENKLLQAWMTELRGQQTAYKVQRTPPPVKPKPRTVKRVETLQLPLQLRWRRYRDMEYEMTGYPYCVVLERSMYVGGGWTVDDDGYYIQEYNMKTNKWSRLPRYRYKRFAMTVINHHLTLVGGYDGWEVTNQLAVYEPLSQHWTFPYNPMPTPHYNTAVLMYDIWLLVAGGRDAGYTAIATVELFNTSTNQWLATSSLPTPCSLLTSAIVDDYGYLVMNSKQVFRVSLPDIVSQTVDQSTSKSPTLWCRLPDTPLKCSTAISLRGYLLAVGGSHDTHTRTDIYLYQPESKQWTKVGNLPNARCYCSCVVLPSGELLVAGGHESSGRWTSRIDVASVLN